MLILQQSRNSALSIKRQAAQSHTKHIDTPKLTTGHFIALERRDPATSTRKHTQSPLTMKFWQARIVQPHPQGAGSTIKMNHKLPAYRKVTPNTAI